MKTLMLPVGVALVVGIVSTPQATPPPYASATPILKPAVFAPGVISTGGFESHPAFMPDGRTLYFLKDTPSFSFWTICVSTFVGGRWGTPEVAPFSGRYADADPFITADGSHFYFISTRPLPGASDGDAKDLDIWTMDRTATGWSEPRRLDAPVNSAGAEWFPTLTRDGTIYFGSDRPGGQGRTDLYRARLVNGRYADAENLGPVINTGLNEFEPMIAPDESFLIFMAGGRQNGRGGFDLFVSYNSAGQWSAPVPLGGDVNSAANEYSPVMSPDGRYFFWTSARETFSTGGRRLTYRDLIERIEGPGNGLGDIYQIDRAALGLSK